MAYTTWVSNLVPVNNQKGTIRVSSNFWDMNLECPKDNFPTLFIDQIIDTCADHEVFSFMDVFFCYNQIQIRKEDQYKTTFTTPWVCFYIKLCHLAFKMLEPLFSRP